jgi:hypothetical protein
MSDWIRLIFCILTVYKIAEFITYDIGPLALLDDWRAWMGRKIAENQPKQKPGHRSIGSRLVANLNCPYCIAILSAPLVALAFVNPSRGGDIFLLVAGLIGAETLLENIAGRIHGTN